MMPAPTGAAPRIRRVVLACRIVPWSLAAAASGLTLATTTVAPVAAKVAPVEERWKGSAAGRLTFRASGTWTCDESEAKDGEELVALVRDGELVHAGRGRMPGSAGP
jgi:hypothetical protein